MINKILLLTHGDVGKAILNAASNTLGRTLKNIKSISVTNRHSLEKLTAIVETEVNDTNNTLILTDLFGATPCNIASQFSEKNHIAVVSGLNLGMLLKSLNYQELDFCQLIKKAAEGGIECIKTCELNDDDN